MKALDNKKVFVSTPETSKAVQEKAFKLGFAWPFSDTNIRFTNSPFLFFENNKITRNDLFEVFRDANFEEITAAEILAMDIPEPEEKFYTFQKVLVRSYDDEKWQPDFYSHFNSTDSYPHQTLSGRCAKQCIDYETNKHFAFTTGKP